MAGEITIVGGGLAGLGLGILLRRREVPTTVIEAGSYPRHRVCGEFMSGRGGALLRELLPQLRVTEGRSVRFSTGGKASPEFALPERALCVSRHVLDAALAAEFQRLGGELKTGRRWTGAWNTPGTVRATGRRLLPEQSGWVGFKVHAENLAMDTDLELHFSSAGYVGISQLPDGKRNVCGLLRREALPADCRANPLGAFHPVLGDRLKYSRIDLASCSSVAGLTLQPPRWEKSGEFSLGDRIALIPPLTGNGMSLALESAFLAAEPLEVFARGRAGWHEISERFSQLCKRQFGRRLRISSILQKLATGSRTPGALLSCLKTAPWLLRLLFQLTR
jgi:menaquinone-9 beta-reductase